MEYHPRFQSWRDGEHQRIRFSDQEKGNHHDLHELDPEHEPAPRSLNRARVLRTLENRLATESSVVGRLARDLIAHCRELTVRIKELEDELAVRAAELAPTLLALQGCGVLTAAKLMPGVIPELLKCDGPWCRLEIRGYRGWLKRDEFYGVYPSEKLE